ncbi:hypothetical protein SAMN04488515_1286 [Cognatiyoonia koreensis]|uniref:Uncharacterized protein n=2 Tax=Cognatiyoonia koreensis TaxID=364200 RepID=A0A1I0PKR2_9RHOB|nr:hypothetical protein SAMN04488515_1286 [Cognatiyoonia koreensis]
MTINGTIASGETGPEAVFEAMRPGDELRMETLMGPVRTVQIGATDPVRFGFLRALRDNDCRLPVFHRFDAALRDRVQPLMYDANRRFRCDDAHAALQDLAEKWEVTEVYVSRGSKRVIIAMPYWGASFIQASELVGPELTSENLSAVIDSVTESYIDDRIAKP